MFFVRILWEPSRSTGLDSPPNFNYTSVLAILLKDGKRRNEAEVPVWRKDTGGQGAEGADPERGGGKGRGE